VGYYRAGLKCKPSLCQKPITPLDLNIFFFASAAESRANFLKLVLDRASKFGWMKNLLQFCFLKFKVVLLFFESLNLTPLNSKSLEKFLINYLLCEEKNN